MADRSSACRGGRHESYDFGWPWAPHVGCWGRARDTVDGKHIDHDCMCACHTSEVTAALRERAHKVEAEYLAADVEYSPFPIASSITSPQASNDEGGGL